MKIEDHIPSRRGFLKRSMLIGSLIPFIPQGFTTGIGNNPQNPLKIHIFSKHLQFMEYKDMAEAGAEMGFDGIDLTVRPKGHVEPERVEDDLPKAVEAMKNAGLAPMMMTTAVNDPEKDEERRLLKTASGLGMKYYRMGYFRYLDDLRIPESIEHFRRVSESLGKLNKNLGIVGCYQNHAGNYMGASIWELWDLLRSADNQFIGAQYDVRHAVVEGGLSWQNGLHLIQPMIQTLAIKDFIWEKDNGKWRPKNVPIGEGMVDFETFFRFLKQNNIQVPASLHMEYPLGGAEHGAKKLTTNKQEVFDAMKKDLQKVKEIWRNA